MMVTIDNTHLVIGFIVISSSAGSFFLVKRILRKMKEDARKKPKVIASKMESEMRLMKAEEKKILSIDPNIITESNLKENKFYKEVEPYDYLWKYVYKRRWFFGKPYLKKVFHEKRKKVAKKPEKFVKVRFKLLNDRVVEFPVESSLIGFMYKKGKYLFDEQAKYETIQGQELIPTYDFHESLTLPIKQRLRLIKELSNYLELYDKKLKKEVFNDTRMSLSKDKKLLDALDKYENMLKNSQEFVIPTDEIKEVLESGNITETENIVNPQTLARYLKSDFIQQLVKGVLTKLVKIIFWVVIIVLLIVIIILILNIITTFQVTGVVDQFQSGGA